MREIKREHLHSATWTKTETEMEIYYKIIFDITGDINDFALGQALWIDDDQWQVSKATAHEPLTHDGLRIWTITATKSRPYA